jgi:hypothetical protein
MNLQPRSKLNLHINKASTNLSLLKIMTSSYEKVINVFGRFKQESIALGLSELG